MIVLWQPYGVPAANLYDMVQERGTKDTNKYLTCVISSQYIYALHIAIHCSPRAILFAQH